MLAAVFPASLLVRYFMPMPAKKQRTLEKGKPLSRSLLWQLQRDFFAQQGVEAWRQAIVPHYVTSNPTIAGAYARVIFGWLRDLNAGAALDASRPLYLIELGAGSGRFSFHFLQHFFTLLDQSVLAGLPVVYVMTDFTPRTLEFWGQQPQLRPFIEAGRLDFARFDGEHDDSLRLVISGQTLAPDTPKNPLGIIANYFFDGLTQDIFYIVDSSLYENLVTLSVPASAPDGISPALLADVEVYYADHPCTADYYDHPELNAILEQYRQQLSQTYLSFPVGGLGCLQRLSRLANGRLLLLSADKGYHRPTDLQARGKPGVTRHGSVSMTVNYHALAQLVLRRQGRFLSLPHRRFSVDICGFLLGAPPAAYPETAQAFRLAIEQGGPDDFFALKKGLEPHLNSFEVAHLLGYLRLSGWDSKIFLEGFPTLLAQLSDAPAGLKQEWLHAAHQIRAHYYDIGEAVDVPGSLAQLLFQMDFFAEAIDFYQHALWLRGPHADTLADIARCHLALRNFTAARAFVAQALALDPECEAARALHHDLGLADDDGL